MKYTLPPEIDNIDLNAIDERKKPSFYSVYSGKYRVIVGKKATELHDRIYADLLNDKKELKGMSACLGVIEGQVKVILGEEDFHKLEQGDILVTTMTRPEFVPLMKKASAIVTDEGGVTCHAAIVSRELGIPCIIGTRTATITLKDGDIIKVDADKGVVNKI
jgi:phosphoenolpyruvate synthase/pyruvate phosphate dikinase